VVSGLSVCLSVCHDGVSSFVVSYAKTPEAIEMSFGLWTWVGPRKHVGLLDGGKRWRNVANTSELSVCSGDTAFCQITLTTCLTNCLRFLSCVRQSLSVDIC